MRLSEAGFFTWREWAGELAAALCEAAGHEPRYDRSHYYDHWLLALERLCLSKGLSPHFSNVSGASGLRIGDLRCTWNIVYHLRSRSGPACRDSQLCAKVRAVSR